MVNSRRAEQLPALRLHRTKLDGIESGADVNAAGAVMESDFTPAFSLLVQQSGTGAPELLQIGTDTIVGRVTGGGSEIDDLSPPPGLSM